LIKICETLFPFSDSCDHLKVAHAFEPDLV